MIHPINAVKALFKDSLNSVTTTTPESMLNEVAWYQDSDMFRLLGGIDRYNPDLLIQKKGHDIYRKMLRDPQVKAAYDKAIKPLDS